MRALGWFLLATMFVTTTGCGGCGGGTSMAEMKRRAIRRTSEDEETPPPPPPKPSEPAPAPATPDQPAPTTPTPAATTPAAAEGATAPTAPAPPGDTNVQPATATGPLKPKTADDIASTTPALALPNATLPDVPESAPTAPADNTGPLGDPLTTTPPGEERPLAPVAPAVDTRHEIPDIEAIRAGKRLLAELYRAEYENAKSPQQKLALAHRLLAKAVEIEGDTVGHYLLLNLIFDLAMKSGNVATSMQALDTIAAHYKVDGAAQKFQALETLSKTLRTDADTAAFLQECAAVLQQALETDDFTLGTRVHELAMTAAKRANKPVQINQLTAVKKILDEAKTAYTQVPTSRTLLTQDPENAEAHLTVGRYLCLYRRDWEQGLMHLSQASDVKLRVLAQIDLSEPTQAQQQTDLGDQWYDMAIDARPYAQHALAARAAHWYVLAFGALPSGLAKTRVQKRLQEIADLTGDPALQSYR